MIILKIISAKIENREAKLEIEVEDEPISEEKFWADLKEKFYKEHVYAFLANDCEVDRIHSSPEKVFEFFKSEMSK